MKISFNNSFVHCINKLDIMKKLLLIILIIAFFINVLYTFGYQGEPMSQVEFLSRTLGSIIIGTVICIKLMNKK